MIFITGDLHGDITRLKKFSKFKSLIVKHRHTLLVCGDFGFVWNGSQEEQKTLKKLEKLDCNIFFVEGGHDNMELLKAYPVEEVCGGKVAVIGKNIFWMQRGEIFDFDGTKVFALGGCESSNSDERIEGVSWWKEEMPTFDELKKAVEKLMQAENKVDIIITHQHPGLQIGLIDPRNNRFNHLIATLKGITENVSYSHWYFGKEHADKQISSKMTAVFEKIHSYNPQ